jgi:hypothetical protein
MAHTANITQNRTCIVSSIRLTVVLGRGSPDFTWYYVPLGAYSVFEPLGGILCTNLPIIWHMLRKRRAMNRPIDGFPKTNESSTRTVGSGSRRSRVMNALGITSTSRTQNDSAQFTEVDGADNGAANFHRLDSLESQKPDPNIWTTVERLDSAGPEGGSGSEEVQLKPGMKKTVWNVRR